MNNLSNFLDTPLGVIIIIVLLVLTAIAAWGAYDDRPNKPYTKETPAPPVGYQPKPVVKKLETLEPPKPYSREDEPCATERAEIERLNGELWTQQGEIKDLTQRLANANSKLEALQEAKQRPIDLQKVTSSNVATLLSNLGEINRKAADDLRNEAKKPDPDFNLMKGRLGQFATYLEQRGFQRPDLGQLFETLRLAFKQ